MARKNIFQIIASNNDMSREVDRIIRLFETEKTILVTTNSFHDNGDYTLYKFVKKYCFLGWKNRGHFIDYNDFIDTIDYNEMKESAKNDVNSFLTLIELLLNFWKMADTIVDHKKDYSFSVQFYDNYYQLYIILVDCLSQYNHAFFYNAETEQVLVIEDKPEVTAVAEIIDDPLALPVIKYNHHLMKGDISAKKDILLKLGSYLEGKRDEVKAANSRLESIIFIMLNSLNIRHNNCDPSNKGKYKQVVADMTSETLEEWYDELYQMILLVILEMDNKERIKKFEELKKAITGGK